MEGSTEKANATVGAPIEEETELVSNPAMEMSVVTDPTQGGDPPGGGTEPTVFSHDPPRNETAPDVVAAAPSKDAADGQRGTDSDDVPAESLSDPTEEEMKRPESSTENGDSKPPAEVPVAGSSVAAVAPPEGGDEDVTMTDANNVTTAIPEYDDGTSSRRRSTRVRQVLFQPEPPPPPRETKRPKRDGSTTKEKTKGGKDEPDDGKEPDIFFTDQDPNLGQFVEQSKLLPTTGAYYPLLGQIVGYQPTLGRMPPRYTVRWQAPGIVGTTGGGSGIESIDMEETKHVLHDEWIADDVRQFFESVENGNHPVANYNHHKAPHQQSHPAPLKLALERVRERYERSIEREITDSTPPIVSTLILIAAFEEALQSGLQYQQQRQQQAEDAAAALAAGGATTTPKKQRTLSSPHPPQYYTTNPTHYLQPPHQDRLEEQEQQRRREEHPKAQMTPATLAQRIRQGCQWAYSYLEANQPPQPVLEAPIPAAFANGTIVPPQDSNGADTDPLSSSVAGRRSSRAAIRNYFDPTPTPSFSRSSRSAATAAREATLGGPEPNPVQKGGRVALWWLRALEHGGAIPTTAGFDQEDDDDDDDDNVGEDKVVAAAGAAPAAAAAENGHGNVSEDVSELDGPKSVPTPSTAAAGTTTAVSTKDDRKKGTKDDRTKDTKEETVKGEFLDDDEDDDEPEDTKDDDEEYGADDAEQDEDDGSEELEDVERERTKLSPVPDPNSDDDNDNDDIGGGREDDGNGAAEEKEEDEGDEEHNIVWDNPYLKPSFPALLEYLSRPKSLTLEEIQKAMCNVILRVRNNKRTSDYGLSIKKLDVYDQIVLDLEDPDHPSRGKVVLKCVSGENFGELQRLDATTFGRCKFELEVLGAVEKAVQVIRKEDLMQREMEYKERKAWDRWRYRGIHEGYCVWPAWQATAELWVRENAVIETTPPVAESATVAAELEGTQVTNYDEALAKSLEENEPSGRRRTTRRGGGIGNEGVFYGNQSQLTQKQLMDALLRLVKASAPQTLMKLQSMVSDDSSDPIRRCRIALGKMIWKRNMLKRKAVESTESDKQLYETINAKKHLITQSTSLLTVTEEEEAETPKGEMKELLDYFHSLHDTEIRLRSLVLKQLEDLPIAIIAAAADERAGSLENLDAADFEDDSTIEWKTSGSPLLNGVIFRPPTLSGMVTDMTACNWYKIKEYAESIKSEAEGAEDDAVERRKRFRAVPCEGPNGKELDDDVLILTEAQVHAGAKAAELQQQQQQQQASKSARGNPFARASGDRITLIPIDDGEEGGGTEPPREIQGRIVGHDNVVDVDDDSEIEYRILILPEHFKEDGGSDEPFWAALDVRMDDSSYVCQPVGGSTIWYSIENQDYHQDSAAFKACLSILDWLRRQNKAIPFLEPVDPVALNIPSYVHVVKKPMDISTISNKLENGSYSSIPPGQSFGRSPVSRMLNGPFRKDIELMFDNAMLFNPPDDWIYQAAAALKKNSLKKIADASSAAEKKISGVSRQKSSMYVDEDSDVDMYEYESDNDEDFGVSNKGRSRKRTKDARAASNKDESAAKAIEHPLRLQHCLKDGNDLRGPFANLRVNTDANTYTMPSEWSCRKATSGPSDDSEQQGTDGVNDDDEGIVSTIAQKKKHIKEMGELLALQQALNENDSANLRRSMRAAPAERGSTKKTSSSDKDSGVEFVPRRVRDNGNQWEDSLLVLPKNRLDVEVLREKRHEEHYAKLYQKFEKELNSVSGYGHYVNGCFPPYLGRVVPTGAHHEYIWEVRSPFVVPALRWVIRGLIHSGHLTATEPMTSDQSSGVILTNDIYYWDSTLVPFEVLDVRELQRRKRADNAGEEESEDDFEMSEYEKLRAARVARNTDRLKALGLA